MSTAWKPLPDDISGTARELVEALRAVKDVHGLTLAEIAARTHYSKASWERWLNGKRLITPQALRQLGEVWDCDSAALTRLLEQASMPAASEAPADDTGADGTGVGSAAGSDSDVEAAPAVPEARSEETGRRRRFRVRRAGGPTPRGPGDPGRQRRLSAVLWVAAATATVAGVWAYGALQEHPAAATVDDAAAATGRPTATAGGCRAAGCVGRDPSSTGCAMDAVTLLSANNGKVTLYIRYSPRCQAAWAKLTDGAAKDTATITTGTGQSATALIHWGYDAFSPMVDASGSGTTLQVCGQQPAGNACTPTVTDPKRVASRLPAPSMSASAPVSPSLSGSPTAVH
ncbi:DUF2690 domain-containing protein [Peterkaempfera sp. SMS 1(5)a]|uniref:DUF2690 domain-containing protein n=1 Tax=Peterkaempfera podocarpi TaxID=3232308 RepID=UPI0036728365